MTKIVSSEIFKIDPEDIDLEKIKKAADLLKKGKIVVFPTETVYGVGVALSQKKSVSKIYDLKGREEHKPLTYHISSLRFLDLENIYFSYLIRFLVHRFFPGPITLIVKHVNGEIIGYRFPSHKIARKLIEYVGEPVLATSANKSSEIPANSAEEAKAAFEDKVALYIDGGKTDLKEASTIIDLTGWPAQIIREGTNAQKVKEALKEFENNRTLKKQVLFVCTGNTCRSPMGEGWMRNALEKQGLSDKYIVTSCGTSAFTGIPPAEESIQVCNKAGIDISHQRSRTLSAELILESDYIFVMTEQHKNYIVELIPEVENRIKVLEIGDPLGLSVASYAKVFQEIDEKCKKEMEWVLKY